MRCRKFSKQKPHIYKTVVSSLTPHTTNQRENVNTKKHSILNLIALEHGIVEAWSLIGCIISAGWTDIGVNRSILLEESIFAISKTIKYWSYPLFSFLKGFGIRDCFQISAYEEFQKLSTTDENVSLKNTLFYGIVTKWI